MSAKVLTVLALNVYHVACSAFENIHFTGVTADTLNSKKQSGGTACNSKFNTCSVQCDASQLQPNGS